MNLQQLIFLVNMMYSLPIQAPAAASAHPEPLAARPVTALPLPEIPPFAAPAVSAAKKKITADEAHRSLMVKTLWYYTGIAFAIQFPILFYQLAQRKTHKDPNGKVKFLTLPTSAQINEGQVFEIVKNKIVPTKATPPA